MMNKRHFYLQTSKMFTEVYYNPIWEGKGTKFSGEPYKVNGCPNPHIMKTEYGYDGWFHSVVPFLVMLAVKNTTYQVTSVGPSVRLSLIHFDKIEFERSSTSR